MGDNTVQNFKIVAPDIDRNPFRIEIGEDVAQIEMLHPNRRIEINRRKNMPSYDHVFHGWWNGRQWRRRYPLKAPCRH